MASLVSMASTFGVSLISARLLGSEQFGALGLLLATAATYAVFSGAWLGVIATKLVSEAKAKDADQVGAVIRQLLMSTTILGSVLGVVFLACSPWIASLWSSQQDWIDGLKWVALLQLLTAIESVQQGALTGLQAYRPIVRISVLRAVTALPLTLAGIHFDGLEGALLAALLTSLVAVVAGFHAVKLSPSSTDASNIRLRLAAPWSWWKQHRDLVIPSFLGALMGAPVLWLLTSHLAAQPAGVIQVGIFTAANQWRNALLFIPRRFSVAALPLMAHIDHGARALFSMTQSLSILACVPLVCGLAFISQDIATLYGGDFQTHNHAFIGVMLVAGIHSVGAGAGAAIMSRGRLWLGLFTNVVQTLVVLLAGWWLIPQFGAEGLFMSLSIAATANLLVTYGLMRQDFGGATLMRALGAIGLILTMTGCAYATGMSGYAWGMAAGSISALVCYAFLIESSVRHSLNMQFMRLLKRQPR